MQGYAVRRNGRPVAGFSLGAPTDAEAALHSIRVRLDRPPWLRGIGITNSPDGDDVILILVRRPEHVPVARIIVGDQVNTVPVLYEAVGDFELQAGVSGGALWDPAWREPGAKLAAMDALVAAGRGDALVEGGGCTEPGGGIVATQRTAREMAALLRGRAGAGLGADPTVDPPEPAHMPAWKEALIASTVGAAVGWLLEELAWHAYKKKRRT